MLSSRKRRHSCNARRPLRHVDWSAVSRILVVRPDNIGDVVLTTPATRALREALPGAEITMLVSPAGAQVLPLMPWADEAIVLRPLWQDATNQLPFDPVREQETVRRLAAGRFDAAIIFTSFSQSPFPPAYACYLAGIPLRVGQAKEFGGGVLSHQYEPAPFESHQAERNLHLLEAAGLPVRCRDLVLKPPRHEAGRANVLLAAAGIGPREPFAVIAPGASCPARRYDEARFAEAARLIAAHSRLPIVAVGNERDAGAAKNIAAASNGASLAGLTSIPQLAAVLSRASLVVCNDSGPMHLADAFATPQVVLYSGTELESQWRPRRSPHVLLRRETDCSPCYRFECPYAMACLDIPPAAVAEAAAGLLADSHKRLEVTA